LITDVADPDAVAAGRDAGDDKEAAGVGGGPQERVGGEDRDVGTGQWRPGSFVNYRASDGLGRGLLGIHTNVMARYHDHKKNNGKVPIVVHTVKIQPGVEIRIIIRDDIPE